MLDLAKIVKDAVQKQGMLAWQYNTIGVSDGITMGGEGVCKQEIGSSLSNPFRYALFPSKSRDHRRQYRDRNLRPAS